MAEKGNLNVINDFLVLIKLTLWMHNGTRNKHAASRLYLAGNEEVNSCLQEEEYYQLHKVFTLDSSSNLSHI